MPLSAIALNCTLKRSGSTPSSTDKMIGLIEGELRKRRRPPNHPHRGAVSRDATMLAANAVHLATMLKDNPHPGISGG